MWYKVIQYEQLDCIVKFSPIEMVCTVDLEPKKVVNADLISTI